jgi:hypothetical protein
MSSNRHNLTLDEQSFQGLLSAAFIIQQHNDRRKLAGDAQAEPEDEVCEQCGAPMAAGSSGCNNCGGDEFRPGERLQHNWASMWLMSQERSLWPERAPEIRETRRPGMPPLHDDKPAAENKGITAAALDLTAEDLTAEDVTAEDLRAEDSDLNLPPLQLSAGDDSPSDESFLDDSFSDESFSGESSPTRAGTDARSGSVLERLANLRVTLRFHRADLYLGAAIFVAALALLWPAASSPQRAALGPFDRLLVTLGIAEAPTGIEVWVDPHTALYYCPGEEPYGKTANGRLSSQRDAQMDRFEPANRSACE